MPRLADSSAIVPGTAANTVCSARNRRAWRITSNTSSPGNTTGPTTRRTSPWPATAVRHIIGFPVDPAVPTRIVERGKTGRADRSRPTGAIPLSGRFVLYRRRSGILEEHRPTEGGVMPINTRPCEICRALIEPDRIEALPETRLFTEHARSIAKYGGEFTLSSTQESLGKAG